MKKPIEFPLASGGVIVVEIDEPEIGLQRVSRGRGTEYGESANETFDDALAKIKPAADVIIDTLRTLNNSPDEVEVEFGMKMSLDHGVVIAANSLESNYRVKLAWKHSGKKKK